MQLFYAKASPFVRKVLVVLEEVGRRDEFELIDGFGSPTAPNETLVDVNPIGKIPCLVIEGGEILYDSRVITRYLSTRYGGGFYPDGDAGFRTLTLEAHADGILDAAVLCVYESRCREEAQRSEAWLDGQRSKIRRGLDELEKRWLDHLEGPVDIGHVGVGCVLGYLDFRAELGGWSDWREGRPALTAWGEEFLDRPSMRATVPG